jgi:hypothetical protein
MLPFSYEYEKAPSDAFASFGKRDHDPRNVAWAFDKRVNHVAVQQIAQRVLQSKIKRKLTERDRHELDKCLEQSIRAVEGNSRAVPSFFLEEEVDRYAMPNYAFDDPEIAAQLRKRYGIANKAPSSATPDALAAARDPLFEAVLLAVERTIPFTLYSKNDDLLFKDEKWRAHTIQDVLNAKTDVVPIPTAPRPLPLGSNTRKNPIGNTRENDLSPPLHDGDVAWFAGWDQYFTDPFPY